MHDMYFLIQCDDGTLTQDHAVYVCSKIMRKAMTNVSQPLDIGRQYKRLMDEAGFIDVHKMVYKWAISPWPTAEKEKTLSAWERINFIGRGRKRKCSWRASEGILTTKEFTPHTNVSLSPPWSIRLTISGILP